MKKLLALFLLSISFLNFSTNSLSAIQQEDLSYNQIEEKINKLSDKAKRLHEILDNNSDLSKTEKFKNKISAIATKVKRMFIWTVNHIDIILSKKGLIGTLLVLGPLFTVYCCFFPPGPVKDLITRILKTSTKSTVDIASFAAEGILSGIWSGCVNNWWGVLKVCSAIGIGSAIIMAPTTAIPIIIQALLAKLGIS